jgi:predicted AlkP superfamily phosphohydrolase/phosphomutase/tetratricopeptide (TPR) repeat protein
MGKKLTNKVLVIGWDAAEWGVINPLLREGKMPALDSLMKRGAYGRIQTLDPPLSPMLWTSIATGKRADKHGIRGFVEPIPSGDGLRPVTTTSRKVKAIWNILNQEGYKSNVVSWWPSNPAEPINGVMVSNLYQVATKPKDEEWPMPDGTVHPASLSDELKELRVHPHDITLSIASMFIPEIITNKDIRKDKRVAGVVKIIADSASVHAAATHLMETTEWDFMAVYYDAIDHFSHLAMKYHPPRRDAIPEKDFETYKGVVEAGYRFQDMMLERMLELTDENTTIVLLSDHGFHCDHQRPLYIPREPSGPAVEHSPYGILVMAGPGIKNGGQPFSGASIIDITPTLLTLFGLPVGKDMEGRILAQCFSEEISPEYIDSWENKEGDTGQHSSELREDPWAAQQAMQQLIELGYIDKLDDDKLLQVEKSIRESDYYVARNLIDAGKFQEAIQILQRIFEESKIIRYGQRLAFAFLSVKLYKNCEVLIEQLREIEKENFEKEKQEKLEKDPNDPFGNQEMEEPLYLDYIEGMFLLAINKPRKALPLLQRVQEKSPANVDLCLNIGKVLMQRKNYPEAEKYFIKALAVDETNARAHHGLGLSYLKRNRLEEALDEFITAVEYNFALSHAHYHLGETLYKINKYKEAAEAFEVAVRLAPGMTRAHRWLSEIYTNNLQMKDKAMEHDEFVKNNIRGEVIVVSGLPRSGTSMMMQMIAAGGVQVLTDEQRASDHSNPKGYMEFEPVKGIHKDNRWVGQATGKAIKVVAPLLHHLPDNFDYKIIFMVRDMDEVLISQQKMLGKPVHKDALPLPLFMAFEKQLEKSKVWLDSQPYIKTLYINYTDAINSPEETAESIESFLNRELDVHKMASAVDGNLYRNKNI